MQAWELALALIVGLTLHDLVSGLLAGLVATMRLKWAMKKYPERFKPTPWVEIEPGPERAPFDPKGYM